MPPKSKDVPRKRGANRVPVPTGKFDIGSFQSYRGLAKELVPDVDDDYELGEIALTLQEFHQQISDHWGKMSKICNKNDDKCLKTGISISLDRRTVPSEVTVTSSYSEKYGNPLKGKVPDPNVMELPGLADGTEASEKPGDGAGEQGELG